jgi:adenine-specific DNA-methyltransferase
MKGDKSGISGYPDVNWEGGGDFVYLEVAKYNQDFKEKVNKANGKKELKELWKILQEKARLSYKVDINKFDENAQDFANLSFEDQKKFLIETLDQNHLYINYSEIEDKDYNVSKNDKKINNKFYGQ